MPNEIADVRWPHGGSIGFNTAGRRSRLENLETWITEATPGGRGWGMVKPFLILRLTVADGAVGSGEAYTLPCRERAVAEIIHALGRRMASEDVLNSWLFREIAADIAGNHRSMDFATATSALEIALWDLEGKRLRKPLCELLGGAREHAVPIYGNIWSETQWNTRSLFRRADKLVSDRQCLGVEIDAQALHACSSDYQESALGVYASPA
ncbi:hypothetical protein [Roseovarius sp. E0-M6]|uniref:hypothetical protein n=1 Tax=Roseovarius sp. E0-M6 TaxID=3127118 RepID=UPI0030101297